MPSNKKLPKIEHPIYPLELPISKKKFKIRPYLKKEDKILLQAIEENTEEAFYEATKQIISNCVIEGPTNLNIDQLPIVDIQYFFLQLRKRSVGPDIRLLFTCENIIDEKETVCKHSSGVVIPIDQIGLVLPEKDFNKIMLTSTLGFMMRYPTFSDTLEISNLKETDPNSKDKILVSLISKIFTDKEMFEDYTEEDLQEFLENLNSDQYSKLEKFIADLPTFRFKKLHKCPKCADETEINIEGFSSFFG